MTTPEVDILLPKDSLIENWDDWPTYTLKNIEISSQLTGLPVSLLTAHKDNPVKVIGYLETIDAEQLHLVRDVKYQVKAIELTDITTYAFAEFKDGSYGFWAAGKAGWFEIKNPTTPFQRCFDMMNEAASMFYMLVDKLRRARKSYSNSSAKFIEHYMTLIFKDYLSRGKNKPRRVNIDDVCAGFHEHSAFLITSMLEGQEGLQWQSSPMLRYFKLKFPDDFAMIEARIYPAKAVSQTVKEDPKASSVRKEKGGVKRGRKPKATRHPQPSAPKTPIRVEAKIDGDTSVSGDGSENEGDGGPGQTNRKRRSILQPTGSKYSKKAAGRRRSLPMIEHESENGEVDTENDIAALQEESPLPPAHHQEFEHLRSNTRANQPLNPSHTPYHDYPPGRYLGVRVISYDLPSGQPQGGLDDLWTCEFEACGHRVRGGTTSNGKARIKAHFQTHTHQAQEKIELAYKESRPYLPVGNLVRRIQSLAPQSGQSVREDMGTRRYPIQVRF